MQWSSGTQITILCMLPAPASDNRAATLTTDSQPWTPRPEERGLQRSSGWTRKPGEITWCVSVFWGKGLVGFYSHLWYVQLVWCCWHVLWVQLMLKPIKTDKKTELATDSSNGNMTMHAHTQPSTDRTNPTLSPYSVIKPASSASRELFIWSPIWRPGDVFPYFSFLFLSRDPPPPHTRLV